MAIERLLQLIPDTSVCGREMAFGSIRNIR
jgi:hypothetical protein